MSIRQLILIPPSLGAEPPIPNVLILLRADYFDPLKNLGEDHIIFKNGVQRGIEGVILGIDFVNV